MSKKHTYEGTKAFLKGKKPGVFVNFGKFRCSWIQILIPNTDPDPGQLYINADLDQKHCFSVLLVNFKGFPCKGEPGFS